MKIIFKLLSSASVSLMLAGCTGVIVPPGPVYNVPVRHRQVRVYNVPTHYRSGSIYHAPVQTNGSVYHI